MKESWTLVSRRRFLIQTGGLVAVAAATPHPRHVFAQQSPTLRIRAVDAYTG